MADLNALIAQGAQFQAPVDPFVQYGRMQQLQQGQQANQLNQMKMEEAQAAAVERNALRGLDPTSADYESQLFKVNPQLGIAYRKERTTAEAQQATQQAQQAQALKTNLDNHRSFLVGVNDQPSYDAWRTLTAQNIPELASILPAQFSAEVKDSLLKKADDVSKQLTTAPVLSTLAKYQKELAALPPGDPMRQTYIDAIAKESQFAPTPLSDTARLIAERDKLPPGSPNRALYDRQIADLGATAQNARDRLAFDQRKFAYEQANPGKTIKEITQEDGSTKVFAIDNRTGMATQVMMAGAPGAAPAGGGRGAEGVPGGQVGPGTPLVGAAKAGALTEAQGNATAFGMRMKDSHAALKDLENKGVTNTGVIGGTVGGVVGLVPLIGDKLTAGVNNIYNVLPQVLGGYSAEQQQVLNGRINFVTALLRKESGAAISPSEFSTAEKLYFPRPGDDATVIKQKQNARDLAIKAMKVQAGPGAKAIDELGTSGSASNDPLGIRGK